MGPAAFRAQFGEAPGVDHDFGMRWGATEGQRVSLRRPTGSDRGLLFAYDPLWDEYAVLSRVATEAAVGGAFRRAVATDQRMDAAGFARLVEQELLPQPAGAADARALGVEP